MSYLNLGMAPKNPLDFFFQAFITASWFFFTILIMMGRSKANVDVIDTVPADEVWKVESMLFDAIGHNGYAKFYHNNQGIFCYFSGGEQKPKFPFWLDSGEVNN